MTKASILTSINSVINGMTLLDTHGGFHSSRLYDLDKVVEPGNNVFVDLYISPTGERISMVEVLPERDENYEGTLDEFVTAVKRNADGIIVSSESNRPLSDIHSSMVYEVIDFVEKYGE